MSPSPCSPHRGAKGTEQEGCDRGGGAGRPLHLDRGVLGSCCFLCVLQEGGGSRLCGEGELCLRRPRPLTPAPCVSGALCGRGWLQLPRPLQEGRSDDRGPLAPPALASVTTSTAAICPLQVPDQPGPTRALLPWSGGRWGCGNPLSLTVTPPPPQLLQKLPESPASRSGSRALLLLGHGRGAGVTVSEHAGTHPSTQRTPLTHL